MRSIKLVGKSNLLLIVIDYNVWLSSTLIPSKTNIQSDFCFWVSEYLFQMLGYPEINHFGSRLLSVRLEHKYLGNQFHMYVILVHFDFNEKFQYIYFLSVISFKKLYGNC